MKRVILFSIVLSINAATHAAQFYIPDGDVDALKAAITASNANAQPDTIHLFPYSTYNLKTVDNVFVSVANALPRILSDGSITNSLTILGNGAKLVLDRSVLGDVRILFTELGCVIKMYDLAFINGRVDYDTENAGALYVSGGGDDSKVDVINCLFKNNSAFKGGAFYNSAGIVMIDNCTFTQNDGMFLGGAISNFAGNTFIKNSVIVNNITTNTSVPAAIYNQEYLFSPSPSQVIVTKSIVALNTYQNASSPDHGKEFDIAMGSAIYTLGSNLIGAHNNSSTGFLPAFLSCSPCTFNDYVGTPSSVIDPLLGPLERHYDYQDTYSILPESLALNNGAGYTNSPDPAIASYGIFPRFGIAEDEITIYGKNLSTVTKIQFEGAEVTNGFTATDTSLVVMVPTGAQSGKITVVNNSLVSAISHQKFIVSTEDPDPDPDPDPVTGIDPEATKKEFSVYPNPTSKNLTVKSAGRSFTIMDFTGRKLLTSSSERIDVSDIPRGVYFIKCGNEVKKLVKE